MAAGRRPSMRLVANALSARLLALTIAAALLYVTAVSAPSRHFEAPPQYVEVQQRAVDEEAGPPGVEDASTPAHAARESPPLQAAQDHVPSSGGSAPSTDVAALPQCETFACLREHTRPGTTKFNAPHFMVIGFEKSATTSLALFLAHHPEVLPLKVTSEWYNRTGLKEASFFDKACRAPPGGQPACTPDYEKHYVRSVLRVPEAAAAGLELATFDGTPHYAWHNYGEAQAPEGAGSVWTRHWDSPLAAFMRRELPWLRLVISVREPISQAISWCHHQSKMATPAGMVQCLDWRFKRARPADATQIDELAQRMYQRPMLLNYSEPVEKWLQEWPAEQLQAIQYERLTDPALQPSILQAFRDFLGLSPAGDGSIKAANVRKSDDKCWPIDRPRYLEYAALAREDGARLSGMLQGKGLGDAAEWMAAWERVWEGQIATCNAEECCLVPS